MKKIIFKIGLLQSSLLCFAMMNAQKKDTVKTANIDEVVVTAYGVKKEKKSLGYAFQDVKGQALVDAKETNVTNALAGKVAGLQIVKSGPGAGSSSKINLRGFNSITGDNQPLIVVDGIPMNNTAGVKSKDGTKNNDFYNPDTDMGNGLSDLNPDDIESVSVLKGGAASALYGSRAGNGVILIITKSGKKKGGVGITYSTSLGFENIFMKPDMQSNFARGSNGLPNPPGDNSNTSSWGPAISGTDMKVYDNLSNFFKTGITNQHNISFQENLGEGTSLYTSAGYLYDSSLIPNSKYERYNFTAKMNSNFGANKRWTTDVKVQYISTKVNNRPGGGQGAGNYYPSILLIPRNIDVRDYQEGMTQNNVVQRWITDNGINPYWSAYNSLNHDKKDRFMVSGYLKYQFNDWLSADTRVGTDFYSLTADSRTWTGSSRANSYNTSQEKFYENNYIASINAKKDNIIGKWGASLSVYGQMMESKNNALYLSAPTLVVPNLFNINNSLGNPSINEFIYPRKVNSAFAAAEINYDGYWFINATTRNDWSSTLNTANRHYNYSSISSSLVLTDMLSKLNNTKSKIVTFAKLRGSYAVAGNSLDPYELYNTYVIKRDPNGNIIAERKRILFNEDVRAEKLKIFELGADIRLFNRVSIDFTYYDSKAADQLLKLPMNPLSGYDARIINAGIIQNKGIEVVINSDNIKTQNFTWNTNINFSKNKNTVNELDGTILKYSLGGFDDVALFAEVGRRFGTIYGSKFLRVNDANSPYNGKLILDANGLPQKDQGGPYFLGDQSPRALFGFTNSFVYKNIGLSFQIDGRIGGKFFSATQEALQASGLAAETAPGGTRESFVVDGVVNNNGAYTQNTTSITQQNYWAAVTTGNLGITEQNIYDATNIRLRNIQLSYNFPKELFEKKALKSAKISATANNVWMIYSKAKGIDPESVFAISSNAVGFENLAFPTTRTYLFSITLGF